MENEITVMNDGKTMTEDQFLLTLKDVIRYDDDQNKFRILDILEDARLSYDKTSCFGSKNNYRKEYIRITVRPNKLKELETYWDYLNELCQSIYPVSDSYKYEYGGLELRAGCFDVGDAIEQVNCFENIEGDIIDELQKAKFLIWVCVCWFTNEKLYAVLKQKKSEGVNVQVIIDDNEINDRAKFLSECNFDVYRVHMKSSYSNLMHDKFCVIDLITTIQGSFNWTTKANYNKESITITKGRVPANDFAEEFMELKKLAK